jgi:hypothetical protein
LDIGAYDETHPLAKSCLVPFSMAASAQIGCKRYHEDSFLYDDQESGGEKAPHGSASAEVLEKLHFKRKSLSSKQLGYASQTKKM